MTERADLVADETISELEVRLRREHDVLSELMEEHVQLKKNLGNSHRTLTGDGRPKIVPQDVVLLPDEGGYKLDSDKDEVQAKELIPLLQRLIPQEKAGATRDEFLTAMKEQRRVGIRYQTLVEALQKGV